MSRSGFEIETARLKLHPLAPGDLEAVHRVWTEPGVRRYLWDGEEISGEKVASLLARNAEYFEDRGFGLWAVFLRGWDEELIGFCGFWPLGDASRFELSYGLAMPHWGRGLATEAARAMIRHGFEECGFERITASADTPNAASLRVMRKAGMRYERRVRRGDQDTTYYSISREDFRAATDLTAAPG